MRAPIGYLFLSEPPDESLPVPDFRTMGDEPVRRASPDLLETVYLCQQRQDWYRDYARVNREPPVTFVGSFNVGGGVVEAAARMSGVLGFSPTDRGTNWSQALSHLIDAADRFGILVMVSGIVGSNTHRKLNPREFRGFALSDQLAPVIFINGADTKAARIFTLAHELVHIALGDSGVDDVDMSVQVNSTTERWCNEVAAEFHPDGVLARRSDRQKQSSGTTAGSRSKVQGEYPRGPATTVRRGLLTLGQFRTAYAQELERVLAIMETHPGGGGNFYNTQPLRVSKRFARAIIESTQEGQALHRDAFKMLGFKQISTFNEMASHLGAGDALPT